MIRQNSKRLTRERISVSIAATLCAGLLLAVFSANFLRGHAASSPALIVGERLTYNVSFGKFDNVAYAELYTVSRGKLNGREAIEFRSKVKTFDFVGAAFYSINELRKTFASIETGYPLYVSKIENNKWQPSLQVLHELCLVLKIGLGDLFNPQQEDEPVVTRAGHRSVVEVDALRRGEGIVMERVIPYAKGHLLQSNIHRVAPGGSSFGLISHEGEEVGYLIAGEIELFVGDKAYRLSAGDTFSFRSEIAHGYRNCGSTEARILFVNTPPTF